MCVKAAMNKAPLAAPVLALALCAAAGSQAADPVSSQVAATFGNTVISTYPDGRSQKIWLSQDGTWTGQSRRGNPLAGTWSTKGDKVCLKQTHPPMFGLSFCQALPDDPFKGVDSRDFLGTRIHLRLVKGRVTKPEG
jgi:hypothetical protein